MPAIEIIISSMTVAVGFFAAALLLAWERPGLARSYGLAAFLLLEGLTSLESLFVLSGAYLSAPHLIGLSIPASMLYGPAIYAYAQSMTMPKPPALSLMRLVFLLWPAAVALFLALPLYLSDGATKIAIVHGEEIEAYAWVRVTIFGLWFVVTLGFLIAALRLLLRHMQQVRDLFSNIEDKSLSWLRWVLLILTAAWIWAGVLFAIRATSDGSGWQEAVAALLEFGWVCALGYFGLLQRPIFEPARAKERTATFEEEPSEGITPKGALPKKTASGESAPGKAAPQESVSETAPAKYARSPLGPERMERIAAKLKHAMREEQLYANSALSLRELSDRIGVSENYISQTLNDCIGQNFFDFVNAHRIAEACHRFETQEATILTVALDVGFNSRSTFNAAFKKHAGMTPSAYREAHGNASKNL